METTTIQISKELKKELENRKMFKTEPYEEVIWDLLEDTMELSKETKQKIKIAEKEYKKGNFITLEQLEKELDL